MRVATALALAAVAAAAAAARAACPARLHPVTTAELFFGRDDAGRLVDDADWRTFVDTEVTPRFPDGLTVWDATGQWRAPGGVATREASKVMLIVLTGGSGQGGKLRTVISAYKRRFHQKSVLLVERRECARF